MDWYFFLSFCNSIEEQIFQAGKETLLHFILPSRGQLRAPAVVLAAAAVRDGGLPGGRRLLRLLSAWLRKLQMGAGRGGVLRVLRRVRCGPPQAGPSVGQLMGDQLVVGAAGGAALRLPLVQPEPDDAAVVLFTDAAHDALVADGGHEVGVLLGPRVALGPEHAVGVQALVHGLQHFPLQPRRLLLVAGEVSGRGEVPDGRGAGGGGGQKAQGRAHPQ